MVPPDILYPVRDGEANEELRYSLRSLAMNFPQHGRVWFVGYKPAWVQNVEYVRCGNSAQWPRANLWHNLALACNHPDMPDEFIIMNDDIYFIGPHPDPIPILYRGPLSAQVTSVHRKAGTRGWWQESLQATMTALNDVGIRDPISYELHVPLPIVKAAMADTLARFADVTPQNPPQWRTLYGNTYQIGGVRGEDGKMLRPGPLARPYMSTEDLAFRHFRRRFQQYVFPDPSPYEVPGSDRYARSLVNVAPRRHRTVRRVRA